MAEQDVPGLAVVVVKVTGVPFAQYVEEKLLHPAGMVNSSFDMAQIRANPNRAVGHNPPWWSRWERVYFLVFGLASVAAILLLAQWQLIGLSLA